MELKEKSEETKKNFETIFWIATIGCIIMAIKKMVDVINGNKFMIYFAILYALFPIIIYIFLKVLGKRNADMKDLKTIGTKVKGEIIEIKKLKYYRSPRISETLVVQYGNKMVYVYDILENDAFSILKMLLDEYPFETVKTIPIDVYTYKNKVYVDLESVDLSKVEGYNDAIKLLEDMKDDMTI